MKYLVVVEPPESSDLETRAMTVDAVDQIEAAELAGESYPVGTVIHAVEAKHVHAFFAGWREGSRPEVRRDG